LVQRRRRAAGAHALGRGGVPREPRPRARPRRGRPARERGGGARRAVRGRGLRLARPARSGGRRRDPARPTRGPPDGGRDQPRRRAQEAGARAAPGPRRRARQPPRGEDERVSGQADRFGGGERGVVGPPGRVVGAADPARAVPRAAAGAGSEPVLAGDGTARTVVLAADPLAVARGALAGRLLPTPNARAAAGAASGPVLAADGSARAVVLAAAPLAVARGAVAGRLLLTPNARAASAVRGARAASRGLHALAVREVRRLGLRPARPLSRLSALRAAVEEVLAPADVKGTAHRLEPVVAELLRVGVASRPGAMEALAAADGVGRRSLEAARVALAYSRHLADRGAVDPAEVLWRAADAGPPADRVLLTGYARPGAGRGG